MASAINFPIDDSLFALMVEEIGGLDSTRKGPCLRGRVQLIREEVQNLAASTPALGTQTASSRRRSKVRRLIMEEIEDLLASDKQPRMGTGSQRSFGPPATASSRAASTPALRPASSVSEKAPKDAKSMLLTKEQTLEPNPITRKTMHHRTPYGGFVCDAPNWQVNTNTLPVLPSKEDELSYRLWASVNQNYDKQPMITDNMVNFADPKQKGAQVSRELRRG